MDARCDSGTGELATLRVRQGHVLASVLGIDAAMSCVEFGAGLLCGSTALLADSLDVLGDGEALARLETPSPRPAEGVVDKLPITARPRARPGDSWWRR